MYPLQRSTGTLLTLPSFRQDIFHQFLLILNLVVWITCVLEPPFIKLLEDHWCPVIVSVNMLHGPLNVLNRITINILSLLSLNIMAFVLFPVTCVIKK